MELTQLAQAIEYGVYGDLIINIPKTIFYLLKARSCLGVASPGVDVQLWGLVLHLILGTAVSNVTSCADTGTNLLILLMRTRPLPNCGTCHSRRCLMCVGYAAMHRCAGRSF